MEYNDSKRIQISRSKYIEESRSIAALRLTEKDFLKGEVVMLNYYKDPDVRTNIGVLVAIGVKDGVGEDCYRILEMGGEVPVRQVGELPDYSSLVHGEIYVWYGDPDLRDDIGDEYWCYVYERGGQRVIEKITGGPYIFLDLETGFRWFYEDQVCKREDDFFSTEQIEVLLQSLGTKKPTVKISSLSGNLFKVGDVKDILLKVKVTDQEGHDTTKDCTYYLGDSEITLNDNNEYLVRSINHSREITVEARQKISPNVYVSSRDSISVKFGYYFYLGKVDENWELTTDNIKSLPKVLHYDTNYTWEDITLDEQRLVLAYPKKYGFLSHIFDGHSMDLINTYQVYDGDYEIDGVKYIAYVKNDLVSIVGFKQKFVFNDPEDPNLEGSTLLDVLTAWKVKNTTGGLVTLDEEGKIPESLYNLNAASTFITITAIVEDYPDEGMSRGETYYVTSTKKLYTALTGSTGVISDVVPGFIYVHDNDFYSWSGQSLRPFSRVTAENINDITEIF